MGDRPGPSFVIYAQDMMDIVFGLFDTPPWIARSVRARPRTGA